MKFSTALSALVDIFVCGACGCSVDVASFDEATEILSESCDRDAVANTTALKSVFLNVSVPEVRPVSNHTHGVSAAARSTASATIDRIGDVSGIKPVFIQGSSADIRAGRTITRSYFWAKDFMAPPSRQVEGEAYAMVDVDYYVDMQRQLVTNFAPHFLYTLVPAGVAKDAGEYKYTFDAANNVVYDVSGGGHYEHPLWDWSGDALKVEKRNWAGIVTKLGFYAVERRWVDDDHQLILLAPLKRYAGWWSCWLAGRLVQCRSLDRLRVVDGEFTRLRLNVGESMHVCTGKPLAYTQACVPARVDDALASTAQTVKYGLTLATVKSKMADGTVVSGDAKHYPGCEVLLEYHLTRPRAIAQTVSGAVRRFQWVPKGTSVEDDAAPGMVAFMRPLLDGAFVPDKCKGNDLRAAQERVEKLRAPDVGLDSFTSRCMNEFRDLLLREFVGTLSPVEMDEVYARQPKPTQRRILDAAQHERRTDKAKNFVKREAYGSVNDPRMISQICGPDKMAYSAYMYPFADIIKLQEWYAFSKTPREIAERVAAICESASYVDNTDFSRMDGRVGNVARELEVRVMLAAFRPEFRNELHELMRHQYCLRGVMGSGVKYDTGLARSSGSPETSAFNTMLNAFIMYLTLRKQITPEGAYLTPRAAWGRLGIYGGDDGLTAGLSRTLAERSAAAVGQKLELIRVRRGELGVSFLARRYGPGVWFGELDSCCDIARQLAKFHVTVHLPGNVTPIDKLREKAFAFSLTDLNTPVIGAYCKRVLTCYPLRPSEFRNLLDLWRVELDTSKQYPNEYGDWMEDILMEQVPTFDRKLFEDWVSGTSGERLLAPPELAERPAPKPKPGLVVLDGDVTGSQVTERTLEHQSTQSLAIATTLQKYRARKPKDQRPSRLAKMKSPE
jgi:hypothetical protein